jgi:hypothetical protein
MRCLTTWPNAIGPNGLARIQRAATARREANRRILFLNTKA